MSHSPPWLDVSVPLSSSMPHYPLGEAAPGDYELVCLPLRLAGADGAPARALLRPWTRG